VRILRHQRDDKRIATVTPQGDQFRLTNWRPNGPSSHTVLSAKELEREIAWDWTEDPSAGETLEAWSNTPEWERGLKGLQVLAAWNTCSFYGRYDLGRTLYAETDIDKALALIPGIMRELGVSRLF